MSTLLTRIEAHYDSSPRASAEAVAHGPFAVFVARPESRWPYYARPRFDGSGRPVDASDVEALAAYQDELGVPRALEWVHDISPTVTDAARAAGWDVDLCPLLALSHDAVVAPREDLGVTMLAADDARLALVLAAVNAGFGGVEPGPELPDVSRDRQTIEAGQTRVAGAFTGLGLAAGALVGALGVALGGGSHLPRGTATELVGIAVIPSARRRGLGAAIAQTLAADARAAGVETIFLSAADDAVARVYERVGFVRVGTAGMATGPA